jgi:hypothetical protein
VLSGYITILRINKQKLDVSNEGPSLETSSFCLFISGSNITTQHSNQATVYCSYIYLGPLTWSAKAGWTVNIDTTACVNVSSS